MKKKYSFVLLAAGLLTLGVLAGCGGNGDDSNPTSSSQPAGGSSSIVDSQGDSSSQGGESQSSSQQGSSSSSSASQDVPFSFTASLSNGRNFLNKDEQASIVINATGGNGEARNYTYTASPASGVIAISDDGLVTALAVGNARITVLEKTSNKRAFINLEVIDASPATGGYNFASLAGAEAVNKRTEILGQLEKYAMDNHLTGITLFENGGFVKYNPRVKLPTTEYITGYGFGLLSEGSLDGDLEKETVAAHKRYLHTAMSSNPTNINARQDTGSQVSDLEGYITQSYWGTRLTSTKTAYEWYPNLAKDTIKVNGVDKPFTRPVPVVLDKDATGKITGETEIFSADNPKANPLGLYSTWRIYVKTAKTDNRLKYRYTGTSWKGIDGNDLTLDGRPITLEDYEFSYRYLLTGSHGLARGTEAAGDQTYGIVGAQRYFNNTKAKTTTDAGAKSTWDNMKSKGQLGISTGTDTTNGEYIQLTILNPIDSFTAMYTLSSNLYSPLPEAFFQAIGNGLSEDNAAPVREAALKYGYWNNDNVVPASHKNKICDFVVSVGPMMLESWSKEAYITFKKNDMWTESGRYNIAGVKMIYIDTSSSTSAIYDRFNEGELDSCGIPSKYISQEANQPYVYRTRGDSTFKLNVNSCTQDMWDYLNKKVWHNPDSERYLVKPWMSNDNFLNGLFYSIDRQTFAGNRGSQPSINYFADSYLNDPENGLSYNDSDAHKNAVASYQTYDAKGQPTYGYSRDRAVACFKAAVAELVDQGAVKYGTVSKPTVINIHIRWMYQTDVKEYGEEIAKYFEDAFNDARVSGSRIKLEVKQEAVTNWMDVYTEWMMKGKFDLGFGAISGNTYNPLNFLEVLKSDNSSTFTLNWGTDTSKLTPNKPLIYQNKMWSFDALWAVADHGGVVNAGENAKIVETCFVNATRNDFYNGNFSFEVDTKFINVPSAKLDVTRIQIFVNGFGGFDVNFTKSSEEGYLIGTINLSSDLASEINSEIRRVFKMDDESKPTLWNEHPFTLENYGMYWWIDVSYSLAIKAEDSEEFGTPTESYVTAAPNQDAWVDDQEVIVYEKQ